MRLPLIATIALLATTLPGLASGGIACEARDANVQFDIGAGLSRGAGNGMFALTGKLDATLPRLATVLQHRAYIQANVAQFWLDGQELNLEMYAERDRGDAYASSTLTIKTTLVEEGSYKGRYTLTVYDGNIDPIQAQGAVTCMAE